VDALEQIAGERIVRTRESALENKKLERFHFSSHTVNALAAPIRLPCNAITIIDCSCPSQRSLLICLSAHPYGQSRARRPASSFDLAAPERLAGLLNAGFAQGDP